MLSVAPAIRGEQVLYNKTYMGVTIDKQVARKIETERGRIPRSRFVNDILKEALIK